MSESDLYGAILREYSRGNCRLFRQNAGFAWQGTVIEHTPSRLILANPRPIRMGVPGMSDLGGWVTNAAGIAQYTAIEGKSARGRLTPEQAAFIDTVRRAGGRAGVARSVEDAAKIIFFGTP
jgi:VRR-NUC domain